MIKLLLILKIILISHEDDCQLLICVIFGFFEPLTEVVEGLAIGYIVHENSADGAAIIRSRDGFEDLLSRLIDVENRSTVSQICILSLRSYSSTSFEPNSTPMVVSLSYLNFPSRNCINTHDFPTPDGTNSYLDPRLLCTSAGSCSCSSNIINFSILPTIEFNLKLSL